MRQLSIIVALAFFVPAPTALAGDTVPSDYPVSACGTLVKDELYECIVFEPYDGHGPYLLDGWGDFKVGDEVHVSGTATYECITFCDYYACIFGAEVTLCDKGTTGDLDGDGDVDGADFLTWQQNLGAMGTGTLATGDANDDMNVDAADLTVWQSQFGPGAPAAAALSAVPEPTTLAMAALSALAAIAAARRR